MKLVQKCSGDRFEPIPRVLHQTWKTRDLPEEWAGWRKRWLELHPDWEHRLWTDNDILELVKEHFPEFLDTFLAFPRNIQRVDAAKILILYTHGGVYADLDTECLQAVEPLIEGGGMVLSRTSDGVIEGAFFASPPGHKFCQKVIERMATPSKLARIFMHLPGLQATGVLLTTGPLMLHQVSREFLRGNAEPGLRILDSRYCSPRSWWRRRQPVSPSPECHVFHHHSDSWLLPSERAVVYLAHPAGVVATLALLALVVLLISACSP